MMLRIDAVRAVGNYRADYRSAEDLDLFLRLMERYDCANLPELGLYYELNEGGISATKRRGQVARRCACNCATSTRSTRTTG
jgi:hypothetical protein